MAEQTNAPPSVIWFRQDLRLEDNPALHAAAQTGGAVVPLFIWAPQEEGAWAPGAASRWWLHHSLLRLNEQLRLQGLQLILRQGDSLKELLTVVKATGARAVFWNRRYEPDIVIRDHRIQEQLLALGLDVKTFNSALLYEPWTVSNKSGKPFQVFTPFWKSCLSQPDPGPPLGVLSHVIPLSKPVKSLRLPELALLPKIDWAKGMRATWHPGSDSAKAELRRFLETNLPAYDINRDRPDLFGTSRLSPHLHFGEISPRFVWHELRRHTEAVSTKKLLWRNSRFAAELGWREFAYHLLYHFPHTPDRSLRADFEKFPWRRNPSRLLAWQRGKTGVPLVDAGMRELWATGWMHNRVRMVVASFLVKNLLVDWREGSRWFWDTLVDADLANNTLGWQWTAGCGADAAPFFRVFNPVTQGQKFDPDGNYIRRWVPELSRLPSRHIHNPSEAPNQLLTESGIRLGETYPEPLVSLFASRNAALEAFQKLKASR